MSLDDNLQSEPLSRAAMMPPVTEAPHGPILAKRGILSTRAMLLENPVASAAAVAERDPERVLALLLDPQ